MKESNCKGIWKLCMNEDYGLKLCMDFMYFKSI